MITKEEKQTIIHMYLTVGYNKRPIARELDIRSKTVHKDIAQYNAALFCPDPEAPLESLLTIRSRYNSSRRVSSVIVGNLKDLIDDSQEKTARKCALSLKKQ